MFASKKMRIFFLAFFLGLCYVFPTFGQVKSTSDYTFTTPSGFTPKTTTRQSTDFSLANNQMQVFALQSFNQTQQEKKLNLNSHDFDKSIVEDIYTQSDPATLVYHFEKKWVGSVPVYIAYYSDSRYTSICELTAYYKGKVFLFVLRDIRKTAQARENTEQIFNTFLKKLKFK